MARPSSRFGRAATMAAVLSSPIVVTAAATLYLPLIASAFLMVAMIVAAFVLTDRLIKPSKRATGWAAACVFIATFGALIAVPLVILRVRGVEVEATVTAERIAQASKGAPSHKYRLVTPDGKPIHGELSEPDDEFDVGDLADVVYDPDGVASPDDVDFVGLAWPLSGALLALWATSTVLCVVATKEL